MTPNARKSLFWIASYPKSGNTWMRVFLANYLLGDGEPLSINKVGQLGFADGDARHYERANGAPYDLGDPVKTVELRNTFLANASISGPKVALIKTHCFNGTISNAPLIPAPLTKGAIYVMRHPGDVAVSYASHYGLSLDEAVDRMAEPRAVVGGDDGTALQFTSDWSAHVASWAAPKHAAHVVRYEDMHTDPRKTFGDVIRHIGIGFDAKRLTRAIRNSRFAELRKQEKADGFIENTAHQPRFFRSGTAGGWRETLSDDQIARLNKAHHKIMAQHGYA